MNPPAPALTKAKPVLGTLEIGRFIAASVVVLCHTLHDMAHYARSPGAAAFFANIPIPSAIAVQFFFVLSGFVMMTAHAGDFGRWAAPLKFWWRRACRIYPMYWLAVAINVICLPIPFSAVYAARLLSLEPFALLDPVSTAWSLRYETGFYVIFGLCLLPYIGRPLLAAWVLAALWCCQKTIFQPMMHAPGAHFLWFLTYGDVNHFLSTLDFYFFAGLLGGFLYLRVPLGRRAAMALALGGAAALLALCPAMQWGYNISTPRIAIAVSLAFAASMAGLANLERNGGLRLGRTARNLGAMSYPLYILHSPIIVAIAVHYYTWAKLGTPALSGFFLLWLLVIYAASWLAAFGFDQPLQAWLRNISPRAG